MPDIDCPSCKGSGYTMLYTIGGEYAEKPCPACDGTGIQKSFKRIRAYGKKDGLSYEIRADVDGENRLVSVESVEGDAATVLYLTGNGREIIDHFVTVPVDSLEITRKTFCALLGFDPPEPVISPRQFIQSFS